MGQQKTTMSVVIPAYNVAEFLAEALDSVLAQTYQPLEVIVVDDGSEDGTPRIAAAYAGKITYIRKERGGPASARNAGIHAASGDWIAFLDADDIWKPELLEKLVKVASDTGADFVFCDSSKLFNGITIGPSRLAQCGVKSRLDTIAPLGVLLNPFELFLEVGCYVLTSGVLVKKDLLLQIGFFDEDIRCGEDLDLWLRLSLKCRFAIVEDSLLFRRIHSTNTSHEPWGRATGELKVYEKLECYAPAVAYMPRWRRLVRKKKAPLFRNQGALYLARGEILSARKSWEQSLRSSFSPTVAAYWLASFFPESWMKALRNWKREIKPVPQRPQF